MRLFCLISAGLVALLPVLALPAFAQQDRIDISESFIALESRIVGDTIYVEGEPMPKGFTDNTPSAANYIIEKCLQHVLGFSSLENSFEGTRFAKVVNPMVAYIPGIPQTAYAHPDLYETLIYDASSGSTTGCTMIMTSSTAVTAFDAARDFVRDTPDFEGLFKGSPVFETDTQLPDLTSEGAEAAYWKTKAGILSHRVSPVNNSTGFIMSIFLTSEAK